MANRPTVCVCVPVWKGSQFVAETLTSILCQQGVELIVRISVDGADAESADVCSDFLSDKRCELTVQPTRLGWVKNTAWLLERAEGDYVCIQPHDDLIAENYLSTLLGVAETTPEASAIYSDIEAFGDRNGTITQPSVTGSPLTRQLTLLLDHFNAVAFRGLTRTDAVRKVGILTETPFENYAADTVWMAKLAQSGELHRVPLPLYRKRFHPANTHGAWGRWSRKKKVAAWGQHCADMLAQALAIDGIDATKRAILARAAVLRSLSPRGLPQFSEGERRQTMVAFFEAAKKNPVINWNEIFAGSETLVLDDVLDCNPYPSAERELQRVWSKLGAAERELQRVSSRLGEIEQSTAWQVASACSRAASRVPFARAVAKGFFHRS